MFSGMKRGLSMIFLAVITLTFSGCAAAVVGGAAAAGYMAHKKGYRLQSPVTRQGNQQSGYDQSQDYQPYDQGPSYQDDAAYY